MKTKQLLAGIFFITIATSSAELSAKIYTWTDKNGKVHFSDKPVADEKVSTIKPKENNNIADTVTKDSQWQQDYNKAKQSKAEQAQKKAEIKKKNKGYCDEVKRQLAIIDQGGRIYVMSPEGERSYQSEAQLQAEKKKRIKAYKKTCR